MKTTNKNLRETVKHINSFAISNGIFQAVRCPQCPKTFRSNDFLQSHLWRKHPAHASSISIPPTTSVVPSVVSPAQVTLVPSASHPGINPSVPTVQAAQVPLVTPEVKKQEPGGSSITAAVPVSAASYAPPKVNDVDSYRLNEIERKCETMSDNFLRLIRELEEQKRALEADRSRKQEEVKQAWEEKRTMEEHYEAQLDKLSRQVSQLQSTGVEMVHHSTTDGEDLRELVRRQEEELKRLQEQIESQAKDNRVFDIRGLDDVDALHEQLRDLKRHLHDQERKHRRSLKEMQESLQKSYENALSLEKDKLKDMMKDLREEPVGLPITPHKPPPSPKTPSAAKKPPTPNMATKPVIPQPLPTSSPSSPQPHPARSKATQQPHSAKPHQQQQPHLMDAEDTESESESDTDTSYWKQSNMKVKHLQISSSGKGETQSNRSKDSPHVLVSTDDEEESQTGSEGVSESLHLDVLLRDNPHLWGQMKEATAEVLASRLSSLGISPSSKGIKTETLTACLAQLRKDRRTLERKHENFGDLRKRLENEVMSKVDDKIDDAEDTTDEARAEVTDGRGSQSGVLTRMVKNVQSKVKESSKAISSSVSKTGSSVKSGVKDIFQTSRGNDVQVLSGPHKDSRVPKSIPVKDESSEEEDEDNTEDTDSESSARIEVHNETMKSVRRNLFSDPPRRDTGTGTKPKHTSGYFDNKTYGEEDESETGTAWDSEPEYENMKEEPPNRTDSLRLSLEPVDLHTTPRQTWQHKEPQPIKLKRPSGEKVTGLTRTIELQLSGRRKTKLAGAVDVSTGLGASKESSTRGMSASQDSLRLQDLQSVSESSNTVQTSMWGSAEQLEREKPPRPSTSRARLRSWDSEEELDISDLE